jgi:hypothetical protein
LPKREIIEYYLIVASPSSYLSEYIIAIKATIILPANPSKNIKTDDDEFIFPYVSKYSSVTSALNKEYVKIKPVKKKKDKAPVKNIVEKAYRDGI